MAFVFSGAEPLRLVPTGKDLRAAADAVLAGRRPGGEQVASIGCNIKWKAGHEPDWFGAGERLA